MAFEELGVPVAIQMTTQFLPAGKMEAVASGMPNLPRWVTPHPIAGVPDEALSGYAEKAIDDVINALTHAPEKVEAEKTAGTGLIEVAGKDFNDALENFNKMCLDLRWGDGLPLVPPTRDKVDLMLRGTDRSPDSTVVVARPSGRAVTVESVAVNAVMAGALPAYMPVIIAILEAWDEVPWGWGCVTTTGACSPFVLVSGPIAQQLDVNSRGNCLSGYGWRANATIGRTVELIFKTVGGARPGITDMSTVGTPRTIVPIVFAERMDLLDELGWPTYAEERGYTCEQNTVAVEAISMGECNMGGSGVASGEQLITRLVEMMPLSGGAWVGPEGKAGMLVLPPEMARHFAELGRTKAEAVRAFLRKLAEERAYTLEDALAKIDMMETIWWAGLSAEEKAKWGDKKVLFYATDPDEWSILVAGGPGRMSYFFQRDVYKKKASLIMKEIELPANWGELLKEADIKPIPMP